jgi:hypothetical protein
MAKPCGKILWLNIMTKPWLNIMFKLRLNLMVKPKLNLVGNFSG